MSLELAELNNLRNEIISKQEQKRNVWLHMYILFISLFVLGLQISHYLFLLTFVILIPYQEVINNMEWNVSRISAYIRVFYESDNPNLNWETMNAKYAPYLDYLGKRVKGISGFVRNAGSIHLGFLATSFFIGYLLMDNFTTHSGIIALSLAEMLLVLFSIGLFFLTVIINQESKKKHKLDLECLMEGYKKEVMKRNTVMLHRKIRKRARSNKL